MAGDIKFPLDTTKVDPAGTKVLVADAFGVIRHILPEDITGEKGDKGWSADHRDEVDGSRIIRKLFGYIGGAGAAPTANVGLYLKSDGTYTAVKADAMDYKGGIGVTGGVGATGATGATGDKGWSVDHRDEVDGSRIIRKLFGYIGGAGAAPTANVGLYLKSDGTYTAVKANAIDYKGGIGVTGGVGATGATGATGDKGWTADHRDEVDGSRIIRKLVGYIGGAGAAPSANIGLYLKSDGTYTAVKADAMDYKGSATAETNATIKAKYEANTNTNAFTDALKVKLENLDNTKDVDKEVLSATKLKTARAINGVNFDGSSNITVADPTKIAKSGDTMTGDLLLNSATPANSLSAAPKQYVDNSVANAIAGLIFKTDVVAASVANVNIASAPANLDGVTLVATNRLLLKDQTNASQNGIYLFNGTGVALTRALDADTGAELANKTIPISSGTVNADAWFKILNDTITLGTTNILFSKVGGDGNYTPGAQITIVGNTISVTEDSTHRFATDVEKANWNGKADNAATLVAGTTTAIQFDKPREYGTNSAPITGATITTNATGAVVGVAQKLYIQRTTVPAFPSTWKLAVGGGVWHATNVNRVFVQYEDATHIFYTISSD